MNPDTVHWLAQRIRHERALWTSLETWLQRQPKSDTRDELFRIINFERRSLKAKETELSHQ